MNIIVLACSGCSKDAVQDKSLPTSVEISPLFTQGPTDFKEIFTITPTRTIVPATITPSLTPEPTLFQQEKEKFITIFLTEDYLCKLPCFAGITPGVTPWTETKTFLESRTGGYFFSARSDIYNLVLNYYSEEIYLDFITQRDITQFIMVPRSEYPINRLLTEYGKPDEIYVFILDVLPIDRNIPYTIYFYYKQGIVAIYHGKSVKGNTVNVCINNQQDIVKGEAFFWLWDKNSNESFETVTKKYVSKFYSFERFSRIYKLEDLSGYTINTFFDNFKNEEQSGCFELRNPYLTP